MKAFLVFIMVLVSLTVMAQTDKVKLYGYAQPVIGGIPSTTPSDEKGNPAATTKKSHANYLFYIAYPKNIVVYPLELWMHGEVYSINVQPVITPVEILYDNGSFDPQKVTLVPETEDTCLQLIPTEKLVIKNTTVKKSLIENNDLVIVYRMKGKLYSQTLKKIKGLRTAALP
jgi:hypothetical protein